MNRKRSTIALVALIVVLGGLFIATRPGDDCDSREPLRIEGDAELVETADGRSVVLFSEDGFTVGAALDSPHRNTEFQLSRYPELAPTTIEFLIPDEAPPRLRDGDGIAVRYGNPIARPGTGGAGWAPADPQVDRGAGFAVLRVGEVCAD